MKYTSSLSICIVLRLMWGQTVSYLIEALRYNPEGCGFESRWCFLEFFVDNPSGCTMVLGSTQSLTEMSTRNTSGGKGGLCVKLTTLPPSCYGCLEIWDPEPSRTLRAYAGL